MPRSSTLGPLKFAAYPEVADAITVRATTIMARWERSVRDELPRADRMTLAQLRDEMPDVLAALSAALAADGGSGTQLDRLARASDGHGRERFHQSYDVNELMIEYALLRPILLDEVTAYLARDLHPGESVAVNMGFDAALRHSVTQFTAYQQDRLRQTAEAQSKYLSFLSHDLRGGLNGVLLMVEVIKRELAGEARFGESIEDLDAMRRSILDTVGTMDRFLHAELFRAGKVQPRTSTVDLRMVLSDVLAQFTYLARDKGVPLQVDIPTGVAVVTDKDLLSLIVQNLIGNAVKYAPGGTAVRVAVVPGGSGGAEVRVEDHGPGIAPAHLARLFEPFTRGETHGQSGVGLGLSIAKQAAGLIGADLRVESTVGVGSTFTLKLP